MFFFHYGTMLYLSTTLFPKRLSLSPFLSHSSLSMLWTPFKSRIWKVLSLIISSIIPLAIMFAILHGYLDVHPLNCFSLDTSLTSTVHMEVRYLDFRHINFEIIFSIHLPSLSSFSGSYSDSITGPVLLHSQRLFLLTKKTPGRCMHKRLLLMNDKKGLHHHISVPGWIGRVRGPQTPTLWLKQAFDSFRWSLNSR